MARRAIPSSHGSSISSVSRYRNKIADNAWFWVEAATFRSVAS